MVKRDQALIFLIGLSWAYVAFFFGVPLFILWELFSHGFSPDPVPNILEISMVLLCPLVGISELRKPSIKSEKLLEARRISSQKAPVLNLYIEPDDEKFVIPVVLTVRISKGWYIWFEVFWSVILGLALLFMGASLNNQNLLWGFIFTWLILGVIVIGFVDILMYQRIKVTGQALIIQRGIVRRKIPWEQAKLFALLSKQGRYELSSERTILRWFQNKPGFGFATRPVERQAYQRVIDSMLVYIQRQTDLPLRDLR